MEKYDKAQKRKECIMEGKEILNYITVQKRTFEDILLERDKDDFYRGCIAGMDIVAHFVKLMEGIDENSQGFGKNKLFGRGS